MVKNNINTSKTLYYTEPYVGVKVYYSYNTIIGIKEPYKDLVLSENVWSVTTAKHLSKIDGGSDLAKKSRMKNNHFKLHLEVAKNTYQF